MCSTLVLSPKVFVTLDLRFRTRKPQKIKTARPPALLSENLKEDEEIQINYDENSSPTRI